MSTGATTASAIQRISVRRMPAEWEPQSALQLTWPQPDSDWSAVMARVEPVFHAIAATVANHQDVILACGNDKDFQRLQHLYQNHPRVHPYRVDSNDTWARDHGPISCFSDNTLELVDFQFNGWGGKYPHNKDNGISRQLHRQQAYGALTMRSADWVLEGGSLESDGQGTLLTTSHCLLNPNRNPSFTRSQLEQQLEQELGFDRVLWLEHGHLEGDDTDAHIDTLARFCSTDTIAYCQARQSDSHFPSLHAMEQELQKLKQRNGSPYKLVPLPLPSAQYNSEGDRLPATYANFLIINRAVLLPVYGVDEDIIAVERIMQAFPQHIVYPINCRPVIEQFGSLHCLTMQIHHCDSE